MKAALPEQVEDALRHLSLTHVVVASGYNLTVLVRAAKRLREKHSKLQTLLLSFSLIGVFLLVTGASPSMVRAGLVSGLVLLAWYFGRTFKPLVILLLVMAGTALAGFAAMLVPAIAAYVALPAHAILAVIVSLVQLLSAVPWVSVSWPITLPVLVVWYVAVMAIVTLMWRRLSRQRRARVLAQQIV